MGAMPRAATIVATFLVRSYIPREKGDVQGRSAKLKEYLDNPDDPGAIGSSVAFVHFLGGSPASAAVNATQPVLMTFPYLSQWGWR